ncbi:GntR family transcriptional regulator [Terrilactibacillus sp. BCM23-1]|uniref:GntR family transcriptional regulator n=1 Tax=Terrilactibacillus tamarindi TaxID=2599694 RepID=A0A6N8CR32_9BACI|nr:GntR family transcriptional regulator [Terrilactibacillus tamarindi]MTT30416.1 GntR family transcriptional regulator [Terrilactibacillus tamarindi]
MLHFPELWMKDASLGERIANELRLLILENVIKPGDILSENQIARKYGTSRSPVRDAMKALANDGLIRLERMGARVLGMSLNDIHELYDVREMIEDFAQQRVSAGYQDQLSRLLNQMIDKMELAAKYNNHNDFAYFDLIFHEEIIRHANHKRIMNLWKSMRSLIMAVIIVTTEDVFAHGSDHVAWVIEKHRKIVRSLLTGNKKDVEQSVVSYFQDSKRTLDKSFPELETEKDRFDK